MPSSATITTFYNFSPNTKARATEVNANFNVFRGHLINVDPNTATSTDLTYDLGADTHRWRTGYVQDIDLRTSTSTATLLFSGDTAATLGAFKFSIEGTEAFRVKDTGGFVPYGKSFKFQGNTTTTEINILTPSATIGGLAFQLNGTIVFAFSSYGAEHQYFQPRAYSTSGAATSPASLVTSAHISHSQFFTSGANVTGSTVTIATVGRPVELSFIADANGGGYYGGQFIGNTLTGSTVTAANISVSVMKDGTTVGGVTITFPYVHVPATPTAGAFAQWAVYGPGIICYDLNPGSTVASNYYLRVGSASDPNIFKSVIEGRLMAKTIY